MSCRNLLTQPRALAEIPHDAMANHRLLAGSLCALALACRFVPHHRRLRQIHVNTTIEGPDGLVRCRWSAAAPEFLAYHDGEWGFPLRDDRRLFEFMCLESFQSGLSWRTILAKRENFRAAFRNFEFDQIARFAPRDVERLLKNAGIVRHRGKIEAVINNARRIRELIKHEGSFAAFVWRYETPAKRRNDRRAASTSPESLALSKDLRRLGWAFVGPTTVHAFRQATGLINDHAAGCAIRAKVERARRAFRSPK
jgi:DNA-3-methyladenine glycosylase I